jgi:hypothetical protein
MNPSLKDQLKEWEKKNSFQRPKKKKPVKKLAVKKTEKLSDSDLRFLMGVDRPRYSRGKGGAWRNSR